MTTIKTVLLDADGVTQYSWTFMEKMSGLLDGRATLEEISEVEAPNLTGERDFDADLRAFVAERGIDADVEDMYAIWNDINPDPEILDMIAKISAQGTPVYMGTNQQPVRGRYMVDHLELYPDVIRQFHSWQIGLAKPDPRFFTHIVEELDLDPSTTLFIDDLQANVDAARSVGLVAEFHDRRNGAAGVREILVSHGLLDA